VRLQTLLARGLAATASLWPDIQTAYGWVHQLAQVLANGEQRTADELRQRVTALLAEMADQQTAAGSLAEALAHFRKVTASYWPGLFTCYTVPGLPRTNNDLEQFFGAARYHERRISGRKVAAPGMVVRGAVRVVAAVATRVQPVTAANLQPLDLDAWRTLRQELEARHRARRAQLRFRRDPVQYLAQTEDTLIKLALPT
jgi:hypothetical protein